MATNPADILYSTSHEWARIEGDEAVIGITSFAQESLGDITYVELPEVGRVIEASEEAAVVESVKAASDIYAPVSGKISEINDALESRPELVNKDPFGEGWFFKLAGVDIVEFDALMDISAYRTFVESCS